MSLRKTGLALLAVCASLLIVPLSAGAVTTSNGSPTPTVVPPLLTVKHVVGGSKSGSKFNGTYGIQRFIRKGNKVYALGTLKGHLNGHRITRYGVLMPASLKQASSSGAADRSAPRQAANCSVLHLVLGPINLNLLGLVVTVGGGNIAPGTPATQPITVNIDAQSGGGLLGNLLSGLLCNSQLSGILGGLTNSINQLTGALNGLTGILGGLGL
jgi:hypothetical protein